MKLTKFVFILTAFALFIAACAKTETIQTTNVNIANNRVNSTVNVQPTAAIDEMASARKIYKDYCAKCHKEDGAGGKVVIEGETIKAANLTSEHSKKDEDSEIIEHIENGIKDEGMPAFKGRLTDEQIKDVVKYIRVELQK